MSKNNESPSAADVAQWMYEEFKKAGWLKQRRAAYLILEKFGEIYTYRNRRHHLAIKKEVLDEFRKLTPDDVVWSRSKQLWRTRASYDPPDTRMVR